MNFTRRAQPWLGTLVEIGLAGGDAGLEIPAFALAFAEIAAVHEALSPQRPGSDLALFNAAAVGTLGPCQASTRTVLAAARALADDSDGAFDITQGSGGSSAWALQADGIRKHSALVRLDAGGIAKGYAVDRAVQALQEAGVEHGWIDAGGDLRVFGDIDLPVHIRDPEDPGRTRPLIALREGALATSVLPLAGGGSAHLSVAAPECLWADALTKVVAYGSPAQSAALLARYHARAWRHAAF